MSKWRFPFILTLSSILLLINIQRPRPSYKVTETPTLIHNHLFEMKRLQDSEHFALTRAFIIGDKRSLTKSLKKKFSYLHLNHLFTPSGIHFSSFLIFFIPLISRLRKRGYKKSSFLIEVSLCLLPFGLYQFYSLKRISILRLLNLTFKNLNFKIDIFYIFILSFLIDFIFGTYRQNPMSFTFSFLFLGSLLSNSKITSIALSFFTANILLSLFFYTQVSSIGFFLGFFLTTIFSLLFPFIFISYWLSPLISTDLCYPFLYLIQSLADVFYLISAKFPLLEIDLFGFVLIILYSYKRILRYLIFALILSSTRIYNLPQKRITMREINIEKKFKNWKTIGEYERAIGKDRNCYRRVLLKGHRIICYKKKN